MSPASSLCYAAASTVTCKSEAEADQSASCGRRSSASSPSSSVKAELAGAAASTTMVPAANDQNVRAAMVPPPPPPLKVAKDSHRIRKPAMPLPQVQYRPPIIIHTYSPKVIHTKPDDFISLVQKLTGSSDTRLRLKRANRSKKLMEKQSSTSAPNPNPGLIADHHHQSAVTCTGDVVNPATAPPQGPVTVGPSRTGCGSPSSSEESTFLASEAVGSDPSSLKQSVVSPRGPLSNYEFENTDSIFSSLVEPTPAAFFSTSHVKSEPSGFPFCNDITSFNFLTGDFNSSGAPAGNTKTAAITGATKGSSSHRQAQNHHHQHMAVDMLNNPYNIDINTPLMPTPGGGLGFYSNPELSPTTARWYSQQAANFMDSSSCLAHGGHLAPPGSSGGNYMQNNPTPILRQRELVRYAAAGGYCPSPEPGSTMVSLENIQAFMFS